jgi:hypothetical protein
MDEGMLELYSRAPLAPPHPRPPGGGERWLVGKSSGSAGRWEMRGPDLLIKKGELSVSVHYHPLRELLEQNVSLYRKGFDRIVSDPEILSGEPVFKRG